MENRHGQLGDFFDVTAAKFGIQVRQVAYHMLTRDLSVAIRGKPIVKAISDWP
jgi:hypothetical protein